MNKLFESILEEDDDPKLNGYRRLKDPVEIGETLWHAAPKTKMRICWNENPYDNIQFKKSYKTGWIYFYNEYMHDDYSSAKKGNDGEPNGEGYGVIKSLEDCITTMKDFITDGEISEDLPLYKFC